jgi:glycosyltransferase involved in cell wall biosynthesis
MESSIKILHVSSVKKLTNGQRQQLCSEKTAAESCNNLQWSIVAFHNGNIVNNFEYKYPRYFRALFLRNLYSWIFMFKNRKKYDFILQRHMMFDPFVLFFGFFINNRVSIYHSKTVEELKLIRKGWKGNVASFFERITGRVNAKICKAIVGVTPEIAQYICETHHVEKRRIFYPNGIDLNEIKTLKDGRSDDINAAFVCGTFNPWHGLEEFVSLSSFSNPISKKIIIHLIGGLTNEQKRLVNQFCISNIHFVYHGYLDKCDYLSILDRCDFGIGSLALHKENLNEATTLKVREYLAMGLPVVANHKDSALPEDFPYFYKVPIDRIFQAGIEIKERHFTRAEVRKASAPYIDKKMWLNSLVKDLEVFKTNPEVSGPT